MAYDYGVQPAFKRRFKRKPPEQQAAIRRCIARLIEDPHHPGLRTKRLQVGREPVFQARADEANRLTFHWEGSVIVLRHNCNHDDTLRNP